MQTTGYNRIAYRPFGVANHSRETVMSKLLLGSLVVAMLALSGLVAYNTFVSPTHYCDLPAPTQDTSCCGTPTAAGCCSEPKPDTACVAKEAPTAQQAPANESEKKDN